MICDPIKHISNPDSGYRYDIHLKLEEGAIYVVYSANRCKIQEDTQENIEHRVPRSPQKVVLKFVKQVFYNQIESEIGKVTNHTKKGFAKLLDEWTCEMNFDFKKRTYHVFCYEYLGLSLHQLRN